MITNLFTADLMVCLGGVIFTVLFKKPEFICTFFIIRQNKTNECMSGKLGICQKKTELDWQELRNSPKAQEEILDQQTVGYRNIQKHNIDTFLPENYELPEGMQDDAQLAAHLKYRETGKTKVELLIDRKEFIQTATTQALYAGAGAISGALQTQSIGGAAKGAATALIVSNSSDMFVNQKNEGIGEYYNKIIKDEETKSNEE